MLKLGIGSIFLPLCRTNTGRNLIGNLPFTGSSSIPKVIFAGGLLFSQRTNEIGAGISIAALVSAVLCSALSHYNRTKLAAVCSVGFAISVATLGVAVGGTFGVALILVGLVSIAKLLYDKYGDTSDDEFDVGNGQSVHWTSFALNYALMLLTAIIVLLSSKDSLVSHKIINAFKTLHQAYRSLDNAKLV